MALESEKDCKEITQRSGNADYDHVYERVRKFLRPLEKRWDYVQSVLLWEKPTHTVGYFIAMTSIFSLVSSGKFRVLLLTGVLMASSLLFEDVRGRVWQLFQQGGFNPLPDLESRDTSTPCFTRLCGKLAAFWCFLAAWLEKLNKLKSESLYKYYAVLFGLLLVAVFAYQYLPLMPILYTSACALYFWPVIKYFGMHKTVQKSLEPFYKPFVVQWQHSRTKRLRDSELTGKLADDSDDEFAEELHPTTSDAAADQDIAVEEDHLSDSEPPSPSTPLEVRLLQGIVTSAVTQGLNLASSGVESTQAVGRNIVITNQENLASSDNHHIPSYPYPDAESPVPESPESFDNSAVFLEGLRVSSLSQIKDGVEVEEGEFMEGLEFPDVDKDTCSSSTESLHMVGKSGSGDHDQNEPNSQTDAKQLPKETRAASKTPESLMTSSGNTDVSDFELLDQAEAEGMTGRDETDKTVASTTSSLGSVTSYVGKWLGY